MRIVKFVPDRDLDRLEAYLADRCLESRRAATWLPARLHDLIFRVGRQESDDGREISADHIYLWEDNNEIAACIHPDGENVYVSIAGGCEGLFPSMVDFSEKNCRALFGRAADGSVKFWFAVDTAQTYMEEALKARGYSGYPEREYMSFAIPAEAAAEPVLPEGFRFLYGEDYPNEENKWSALRLSFHPDWEAPGYRASMAPYNGRKSSSMYRDSFECVIADEACGEMNDVCAYCFVYVDKKTGTALIEPVGVREKYTHRGLGTALMRGAIKRCGLIGVEKCYVDNFGRRNGFYTAAGFQTESSTVFWYKTLMPAR